MVEVLGCYSNRASYKIDKLDTIRDALDRIDAGKLRRPPVKRPRPAQRYRLTDRYSPELRAEIVSRYVAGEPSTKLSKEYDIAKSSLLRMLADSGIQSRSYRLTKSQEKQIRQLRSQGMALRTIANMVGCGYGTVQALMAEKGD